MNETDAIRLFKSRYVKDGFWKKLHGNTFQSGLPDILWISSGGVTNFLEFKIVKEMALPWAKLRLNQHLTMLKMYHLGALVRYVVYSNEQQEFFSIWPIQIVEGQTHHMNENDLWKGDPIR